MSEIKAGKGRKKRKVNSELRGFMAANGMKKRSMSRRQMAAGERGPHKNNAPKS